MWPIVSAIGVSHSLPQWLFPDQFGSWLSANSPQSLACMAVPQELRGTWGSFPALPLPKPTTPPFYSAVPATFSWGHPAKQFLNSKWAKGPLDCCPFVLSGLLLPSFPFPLLSLRGLGRGRLMYYCFSPPLWIANLFFSLYSRIRSSSSIISSFSLPCELLTSRWFFTSLR